jgi:hypothetical protein
MRRVWTAAFARFMALPNDIPRPRFFDKEFPWFRSCRSDTGSAFTSRGTLRGNAISARDRKRCSRLWIRPRSLPTARRTALGPGVMFLAQPISHLVARSGQRPCALGRHRRPARDTLLAAGGGRLVERDRHARMRRRSRSGGSRTVRCASLCSSSPPTAQEGVPRAKRWRSPSRECWARARN